MTIESVQYRLRGSVAITRIGEGATELDRQCPDVLTSCGRPSAVTLVGKSPVSMTTASP